MENFRSGAEGMGYWAFGDSSGASSWNEYAARAGAFTPLFLDRLTVTPAKHMEAIREGVEDYEVLRMLHDRVEERERAGDRGADVAAARKLLEEGPARVTGFMTSSSLGLWKEPKDREAADRVRIEAMDALVRLNERR